MNLEEENASLRAQIHFLMNELTQRDRLIAALESQINNLRILRKESEVSSMTEEGSRDTMSNRSQPLTTRGSPDASAISPHPLEPPRRSLELPRLMNNSDVLQSGIGTQLDSAITEESENADGDESELEIEKHMALQSNKGAIKALPRELSIPVPDYY